MSPFQAPPSLGGYPARGFERPPNQALQQTAAAILVFRSSLPLGAAAAAELHRSAAEHCSNPTALRGGFSHAMVHIGDSHRPVSWCRILCNISGPRRRDMAAASPSHEDPLRRYRSKTDRLFEW